MTNQLARHGDDSNTHTHTHTEPCSPISLDISLLKAVSELVAALEQVGVEHILQLGDSRLLLHTLPTHPHHLLLHMIMMMTIVVMQA